VWDRPFLELSQDGDLRSAPLPFNEDLLSYTTSPRSISMVSTSNSFLSLGSHGEEACIMTLAIIY
jgi:hypothetical protein